MRSQSRPETGKSALNPPEAYRRLFILLRREGESSGINRIYWFYSEKRLTVRKRKARRKAIGTRPPDPDGGAGQRAQVMTSNEILKWCAEQKVEWHYIAPGKPMRDTDLSKASTAGCGTSF